MERNEHVDMRAAVQWRRAFEFTQHAAVQNVSGIRDVRGTRKPRRFVHHDKARVNEAAAIAKSRSVPAACLNKTHGICVDSEEITRLESAVEHFIDRTVKIQPFEPVAARSADVQASERRKLLDHAQRDAHVINDCVSHLQQQAIRCFSRSR